MPVPEDVRAELEAAGLPVPPNIRAGKGCEACGGTGYSGRTGVFEVMRIDDRIRDAISERAPLSEIRKLAVDAGLRALRYRGLQFVAAGITSLEEVHRHTIEQ